MDTRTLNWWESAEDLEQLAQMGWNFQVGVQVATQLGPQDPNIVWRSSQISPSVSLTLQNRFALSYTRDVPPPGATVTADAPWQQCALGEAYDIDQTGMFVPSSSPGQPGWLTVGSNDMGSPLHILVGMFSFDTGSFETIYIDFYEMIQGQSASYQPLSGCTWWLAPGSQGGTFVDNIPNPSSQVNMQAPNPMTGTFEWWTTYKFPQGAWITSGSPPGRSVSAREEQAEAPSAVPESESEVVAGPFVTWQVQFALDLPMARGPQLMAFLVQHLRGPLSEVNIRIVDSRHLVIMHPETAPGRHEAVALINAALGQAEIAGILPQGDSWVVSGISGAALENKPGPLLEARPVECSEA